MSQVNTTMKRLMKNVITIGDFNYLRPSYVKKEIKRVIKEERKRLETKLLKQLIHKDKGNIPIIYSKRDIQIHFEQIRIKEKNKIDKKSK